MRPQPQSSFNDTWWELATQWSVVRRGIAYAVVVGAILIAINHGDSVLQGDLTFGHLVKMALTVIVPYLVSTFSSVGALRKTSG
jgi:hypothetical protein